MALVLRDRVRENGTANTTVSFTLTGAVTGYQDFSSIGNGNVTFYAAEDGPGNWEVGVGTYSSTGPTLTRDVILSSSNAGSAVTFSGTVAVLCSYPSEKSVNLDSSGNVSPLGTIASGLWNGTTIGVAYGGTGVTASSGANSVVLRDSSQNISVNHDIKSVTITTSAGGTTALTAASHYWQTVVGTSSHTFNLPDATTILTGFSFVFDNDSTGTLTIKDYAGSTLDVIAPGGYTTFFLEADGTVAGDWNRFGMIPAEVNWGTNSLDLGGSTVITNGTWQGTPIAYNYGGTGLNTFAGANNALYSTSASTLTAGTLPIAAGGTGKTTASSALTAFTGFTTTATAAGTTVLDNTSSFYQLFTGTSTQTITLPVTSTLALGWSFHICNNSTGNLTVNSSGSNLVITVLPGTTSMVTCIATGGTSAADWEPGYTDFSTATGTGSVVLATSPQITSLGVGTPASGTTGEIRATNNVTAYYSSDRSLKENIKNVDNALDIVCAIGSKTFDWTDEYIASKGGEDGYFVQKSDFGVVAQDVQAVFPQAVRTREDGTLAVDYEKIATLSFGAISQLLKRIEALEAK